MVSGIPFALIELISGGDGGSMKSAKIFKLFRFLKLGRLLKFEKILQNLDVETLDYIQDFLQVSLALEVRNLGPNPQMANCQLPKKSSTSAAKKSNSCKARFKIVFSTRGSCAGPFCSAQHGPT